MSRATFEELVTNQLEKIHQEQFIVDTFHGYAIIKQWLDNFWDILRSSELEIPQEELLRCLVNMASVCRLLSEAYFDDIVRMPSLPERDNSYKAHYENTITILAELIGYINTHKRKIEPLQKGIDNFSFEFDELFLEKIKEQVQEIL